MELRINFFKAGSFFGCFQKTQGRAGKNSKYWSQLKILGFGDLDLKKGVDHDLKLEKGEVWNKI